MGYTEYRDSNLKGALKMFGFSWTNNGYKSLKNPPEEIITGCDYKAARKIIDIAENDRCNTSSRSINGHYEQFYFRKGKKGKWKEINPDVIIAKHYYDKYDN